MLGRPSNEMSRTLQKNGERKTWSTDTRNYTFAIEGTVCITEIKMKLYQKPKNTWVLEKTQKHNVIQQQQICKPTQNPKELN